MAALLAWYDRERRDLPWRVAPGGRADPYAVWLSEIMLQQTTVKAAGPYFQSFLARWPTIGDLAAADEEDVLRAWAGLGYYSRARNLLRCAIVVVEAHGGRFPRHEAELLKLPGIGPYTAAAIAAIAFNEPATPVDGNVERVTARLYAVQTPLPAAKGEIKRYAAKLTPRHRPGDFAQAMMDLGARICTPRRPSCMMCPVKASCAARAMAIEGALPAKARKAERPTRYGIAFVALGEDGRLLLRQRPERGLLAKMIEVPSTDWVEAPPPERQALRAAPIAADWWAVPGTVVHVFTHFRLELAIYRAIVPAEPPLTFWADAARCRWVKRGELDREALPSVMRKVIAHGLAQQ